MVSECLPLIQRLNALAALVRGQLPSLHRNIITALITIDVHARDIVTDLVRQKVHDCGLNVTVAIYECNNIIGADIDQCSLGEP